MKNLSKLAGNFVLATCILHGLKGKELVYIVCKLVGETLAIGELYSFKNFKPPLLEMHK